MTDETDAIAREERSAGELARAFQRLEAACGALRHAVTERRQSGEVASRRDDLAAARLAVRRLVLSDEELEHVQSLRTACRGRWLHDERREYAKTALAVIGRMVAVPP